jgi:hypothetical protein
MKYMNGFNILYLEAAGSGSLEQTDGVTRFIRNIEETSERYKQTIKIEIAEERQAQTKQAESIDHLRPHRPAVKPRPKHA